MILLAENEAACAALTNGAAKDRIALTLVYTPRAIAARYEVLIWAERVSTKVNPADLPLRSTEPSPQTEPKKGLATFGGLFFCARSLLDASARGVNRAVTNFL